MKPRSMELYITALGAFVTFFGAIFILTHTIEIKEDMPIKVGYYQYLPVVILFISSLGFISRIVLLRRIRSEARKGLKDLKP